jgi:hypothetical protein
MNKAVQSILMVGVAVVALGAIGGAAFYQEEVGGYIRLQGWNLAPVTEASKQFVQAAAANDGKKVASLLAKDSSQLSAETGASGVTAFRIGDYGGPKRHSLKALCPTPSPKLSAPKLVYLDGATARVEAAYPKHRVQLTWDRKPEGWRLIGINRAQ